MKKCILIGDDDEGILDVVSYILEQKGYEVVTASVAEEIIDRAITRCPEMILLDLWMPVMSGEEVTKILKSNPATAKIPIIILSAHMETKKRAERAGADGYLLKPFDITALEQIVDRFTSKPAKRQ